MSPGKDACELSPSVGGWCQDYPTSWNNWNLDSNAIIFLIFFKFQNDNDDNDIIIIIIIIYFSVFYIYF